MAVDEVIIQDPAQFDKVGVIGDGQQEPLSNYSTVRKTGDKTFIIVHKTDEEKNMEVSISIQGEYFEWIGLPPSFAAALDARFERPFQKTYPDVALRTFLVETI